MLKLLFTMSEDLSKVSFGEGLACLYSELTAGTLAEKYHIKITDLADSSYDQNRVSVINKNNDEQSLHDNGVPAAVNKRFK
ncbi:hypothetical protein [Loigolactobacillus jiayinensis]|uniref:Uncharacterized protein n=1 Tax=Loigolactobacillus jiayinensis TaxID=2486016 RepID=A0ABW1R9U9_9LACO|nr:hypothetical protein [Loigolactobacillus jiayinensis]